MSQIELQNSHLWSTLLDWNPQLFREIRGKFKTTNVAIAAAVSVIVQFIAVISLLGKLPDFESTDSMLYGRYGMGIIFHVGNTGETYYTQNSLGDWIVNWQLLWLDLFIILSFIATTSLLVVGTYMLIADMIREQNCGTLNFIRQTPQSAHNILLGKVLGVPILLYVSVLLLFPLHLLSGIKAQVPLGLILGFDLAVVASCAFFYSIALLWSLTNFKLSGFKPWFASGLMWLFLFIVGGVLFDGSQIYLPRLSSWLLLFHPNFILSYIVDAAHLPDDKYHFLAIADLAELKFYGQALWINATIGIGFILANFILWSYWCWSVLQRRFYNPEYTLLGKIQSYWITGWFTVLALGFTIQSYFAIDPPLLSEQNFIFHSSSLAANFFTLNFSLLILGLMLIAGLSPHRQALQDWARYRHQRSSNKVWQELIWGENSPSTVAIAINTIAAAIFIIPSIFLLLDARERYIAWGFLLIAGTITLYAAIVQSILLLKTNKRAVWSAIILGSMVLVPPVGLSLAEVAPKALPAAWLTSILPAVAIEHATLPTLILTVLGQWLGIALIGFQITKKLQRAGASETKMLFERNRAIGN